MLQRREINVLLTLPQLSQTTPSSILDWILTFADIADVAAIGLVVAIVYFQSRQRKFAGLSKFSSY